LTTPRRRYLRRYEKTALRRYYRRTNRRRTQRIDFGWGVPAPKQYGEGGIFDPALHRSLRMMARGVQRVTGRVGPRLPAAGEKINRTIETARIRARETLKKAVKKKRIRDPWAA